MIASRYKFCNSDINKYILMLRKCVHLYKYMNDWKKFNETSLPKRVNVYSNWSKDDITIKDYGHAKRVWEEFVIKNSDKYYCLYIQNDTLLIVYFFESFQSKAIEILTSVLLFFKIHFSTSISMVSSVKKTKVEVELLTEIDMLLMIRRYQRWNMAWSICRS